jgi:hypothetical protein
VRLPSIPSPSGQRRRVDRILARAMMQPWADCWQTLRRSCEIEWAQTHPQYAVSRWIGHSISVSGRHYANSIPNELFDRASGLKRGAQNTGAESSGIAAHERAHGKSSTSNDASKPLFCRSKREGTHVCATSQNGAGGNRTPVPTAVSHVVNATSHPEGAQIGAHLGSNPTVDPDLAAVIAAWELLPGHIRQAIRSLAAVVGPTGAPEGSPGG